MTLNHLSVLALWTCTVLVAGATPADDKPVAPVTLPVPAGTNSAPDLVLVKGRGLEIKRSQLDLAWAEFKKEAAGGGQEIAAADLPKYEPKLLNHLILVQLLQARATDADKAKGKAEAEERLAELKKQFHGDDMFTTMIKSAGLTPEGLLAQLTTEGVSHAVLRGLVKVAPDQVKKYFDEHQDEFSESEKVRASHILVGTRDPKTGSDLSDAEKQTKRALADDLLKRARAGEDFAKLAKQYSDDPGSKDSGGEYKFGRGEMMPEFEKAAFALKTNEVSEVVTTPYGYHVIKLSERFPGKSTEFAQVSAKIAEELGDQQIEKQFPQLYAQLRKEANVEFVDPKLKAADEAEALELAAALKAEQAAREESAALEHAKPAPAAPKAPNKP